MGKYLPVEGEFYINPDEIRSVSMEYNAESKGDHYEVILKGGTSYFISEECYNKILRYNGVWEEGMELPPAPEIEPTKPDYR